MLEAPALRPLSVGDIIDRTLRLYRANPVLFIAIAVLPDLVIEVLQRAFGLGQTIDPNDLAAIFGSGSGNVVLPRQLQSANPGAFAGVAVVASILSLVQASALIYAIGRRYLGTPVTVGQAYASGLRSSLRLLLSALLIVVAFAAALLLLFALVALLNSGAVTVIAVIVGFVGVFFVAPFVFLSLAVVAPAIVLEGLGPIAGIRRSFHLMAKSRWRALGLYTLIGIISGIVGLIFGLVFLVSFVSDPTMRAVLQTIANVASAIVTGPLLYGSIVILYYDLRVRKEAFDLQLAAEALPREQ